MRDGARSAIGLSILIACSGGADKPTDAAPEPDGPSCVWRSDPDLGGCATGSPGPTGAAQTTQALGDGYSVVRNLTYGTRGGRVLQGDLFLPPPSATTRPGVLMVVHGGGWMDCGRRRAVTEWYAAVMSRLTNVATFNIEYRLLQDGGGYPENLGDVKCAVQWLGDNGSTHGVDGRRVVVAGESAGAHLALMTGVTGDRSDLLPVPACGSQPPRVAGVVSFSGPSDMPLLNNSASLAMGVPAMYSGPCDTVVEGCDAERSCDRCVDASPAAHACAAGDTRFVVVQAVDPYDPIVPQDQAQRMADALTAAGRSVTLVMVSDSQLRAEGCEPGFMDLRTPHGLNQTQTCLTTPSGPAVSQLIFSTIEPRPI